MPFSNTFIFSSYLSALNNGTRKVFLLIGCYIVKCLLPMPYISFIIHDLQGNLLSLSLMHQVLQGMIYSYQYT